MPEIRTVLSDESQRKIEELARDQQREPGDVLDEALERYAASQMLEKLSERLERRALAKGIREEDVPKLVEEVRRENQAQEH
jgi:predicted transcriptional regulator